MPHSSIVLAKWLTCWTANQKVARSNPSQDFVCVDFNSEGGQIKSQSGQCVWTCKSEGCQIENTSQDSVCGHARLKDAR